MKTAILAMALLATLCITARARLGETPAQCQQRYGKPLVFDGDRGGGYYATNGFEIITKFTNGVVSVISYFKPVVLGDMGNNLSLTREEVNILLTANAQGSTWNVVDAADVETDLIRQKGLREGYFLCWRRADGRAVAIYDELAYTLSIAVLPLAGARKKEEGKRLKGF